jgi:hypothetical protein
VSQLKAKGKWIPAFDKMGLPAIFTALSLSTAVVEFGEGEKATKTPVAQVLFSFIEGLGEIVPVGEIATGAKSATKVLRFNEAKGIDVDQDSVAIRDAATKIAAERKVDFGEALKIARREFVPKAGSATASAV